MNNTILNKMILMVVFVVLGLSVPAFANINVSQEGKNLNDFASFNANLGTEANNIVLAGFEDVSSEGKNIVNFDSQMVDTNSNYGVAPTWGNTEVKDSSWYELNILGR